MLTRPSENPHSEEVVSLPHCGDQNGLPANADAHRQSGVMHVVFSTLTAVAGSSREGQIRVYGDCIRRVATLKGVADWRIQYPPSRPVRGGGLADSLFFSDLRVCLRSYRPQSATESGGWVKNNRVADSFVPGREHPYYDSFFDSEESLWASAARKK